MKVLVTGGYGFIAGHVIEELKRRDVSVITNVRHVSMLPDYLENVDVFIADNRDETAMRAIIEKVDVVINLAGILGTKIKSVFDLDTFYENNVKGSHSVIKACMAVNAKLVQIAVGNYFEYNFYSNTKTAVERDVLALTKYAGLKGIIVRGLNAYGPRQKVKNTGKIVPTFITKALNNEDIEVYGGKDNCGLMDMIYVKDLAKILVDTALHNENYGEIIEAGTGVGVTVYDMAKMIVSLTKSNSKIVEVPMRAGESEKSIVVAQKPYKMEFTSLEQGLLETIEYYKNAY